MVRAYCLFQLTMSQSGDQSIAGISKLQSNAGARSSARSPGHCGWLRVFISRHYIIISSVTLGRTQGLQGCVCKCIVNHRGVDTGVSVGLEWFQPSTHFSCSTHVLSLKSQGLFLHSYIFWTKEPDFLARCAFWFRHGMTRDVFDSAGLFAFQF